MCSPCTWAGCDQAATHPQVAADGEQWANLCDAHDQRWQAARVDLENPSRMLGCWVNAQGGARAATDRMQPTIDAISRFMQVWSERRR